MGIGGRSRVGKGDWQVLAGPTWLPNQWMEGFIARYPEGQVGVSFRKKHFLPSQAETWLKLTQTCIGFSHESHWQLSREVSPAGQAFYSMLFCSNLALAFHSQYFVLESWLLFFCHQLGHINLPCPHPLGRPDEAVEPSAAEPCQFPFLEPYTWHCQKRTIQKNNHAANISNSVEFKY